MIAALLIVDSTLGFSIEVLFSCPDRSSTIGFVQFQNAPGNRVPDREDSSSVRWRRERPGGCYGGSNGSGIPRDCARQRSQGADREDPGVQGHGALLRKGESDESRAAAASRTSETS